MAASSWAAYFIAWINGRQRAGYLISNAFRLQGVRQVRHRHPAEKDHDRRN
jgi:hypothetical protein